MRSFGRKCILVTAVWMIFVCIEISHATLCICVPSQVSCNTGARELKVKK